MRMTRDMAFMAMGGAAVLMYQKYNKPVMRKMEKVVDNTMKKVSNKLENME